MRIQPYNPLLVYSGRIDWSHRRAPVFIFPCTSVSVRFTGQVLKVHVENRHAYWDNFLGYLLDGEQSVLRLPEDGTAEYEMPIESGGEHELLLFKRQDSCHMVQIHGFLGSSDLELLPCAPLPFRRIEVYGDSVSAGEVSEAVDYCGQPDPVHNGEYSNSYYSYAWLTARKLGARLHDIAQGGIALTDGIGYFMEPEQKGMESIFDKIQYDI